MDPETREVLRAAEEAVTRLVELCRKDGPLYSRNPKAVAQASRTGKWLLNAIAAVCKELDGQPAPQEGGA